jgi:hypothetical protein
MFRPYFAHISLGMAAGCRVSGCLRAAGADDAGSRRVAERPEVFTGRVYHTSVDVKVKSSSSFLRLQFYLT